MFHLFEAETADAVWQQVASHFRQESPNAQEGRGGLTQEILHAAICVKQPRQRWVLSRRPVINLVFALVEIIWIVRGRNDAAFLNFFNRQLPKFAGDSDIYHGAYGFRFRKSMGFDQLERAYHAFKANPHTRQVVLQIWDADRDMPDVAGNPKNHDIPCNISSILKLRDGALEWLQVMRSNDVFLGLPYNIVQFTTLQEILAGWLNVKMGEYHHISDSLHIYDNSINEIQRSSPSQKPNLSNSDSLAVSKEVSDHCFAQLEKLVIGIITKSYSDSDLVSLKGCDDLPQSFRNIATVITAEALRRRDRVDFCEKIRKECSNPAYNYLYDEWLLRVKKGK